jgi:hypothetical protein
LGARLDLQDVQKLQLSKEHYHELIEAKNIVNAIRTKINGLNAQLEKIEQAMKKVGCISKKQRL